MDTDFIDSIIINLKIISLIQINEKLGIHNGHLCINKSSNVQFLRRWFNRYSRNLVLKFIKDLRQPVCGLGRNTFRRSVCWPQMCPFVAATILKP